MSLAGPLGARLGSGLLVVLVGWGAAACGGADPSSPWQEAQDLDGFNKLTSGVDHIHDHGLEGPACAHNEDIGPVQRVERPIGLQSFSQATDEAMLAADSGMFCPSGFSFEASLKLCTKGQDALGPFPPAMVALCKANGGGPACDNVIWNKNFAASLRGGATCPAGTATQDGGYCAAGGHAFGPFSPTEVAACEASGGGAPCRGMRWALAFAESLVIGNDATKPLRGLWVSIDSGHGGNPEGFEPGVVSPYWRDVTDYLFNLATTTEVADSLRRRGARVKLFQYRDPFSGPELEGKGSRARGSHVFMSVHHNGANRSAQGSEVFVHGSLASEDDRRLAFFIQDRLVAELWNQGRAYDRGVKSANFGVLRGAANHAPAAVLVESFFIDTRESLETFDALRRKSSRAIADGVTQYWLNR
jgi:N-acetylmuramoyl-L-alanine amidase